ncbi:hypothetical protein ABT214_10675 [Micromonospora purpureochromogenes]
MSTCGLSWEPTRPAYLNTFQRGIQGSVWETGRSPPATVAHGGQYG